MIYNGFICKLILFLNLILSFFKASVTGDDNRSILSLEGITLTEVH